MTSLAELLADRVEWINGAAGTADTTVLVLLRSLRPSDLVHGTRTFAASLDAEEAAAWRRSWTRTRFLFGNPANVSTRPRVIAPGRSAAWLGPFPDDRRPGLARLLKPVSGALPSLPSDVYLSGTGPMRDLQLAVAGLTLVDYLVHLHHTLAEAVLLGRLRTDEPIRLRHLPEIVPTSVPPAYARVLPDGDALRPHTWLS